ncbi:hypothetical protein [Agrococcus casei]|uniref:hypothetical protein n=1 Tax=Agrococcus casei TaxID=343512 RepID=UPI000B3531EB|nr:hypothetical protein [Agrococcus casei]
MKKKILVAAALAASLMFASAPAYAGTAYSSFSNTLPNLQQPRFIGSQTKTYSSMPGNVHITNVGSNYTVNVKLRKSNTFQYGTEVKGLDDGQSAQLQNSFSAGTTNLGVTLTNSTWTYVTVAISGSWRTN